MPTLTADNPRAVARETERRLPKLDTARAPAGLATLGEPFGSLVAERSRLMKAAIKARTAASKADLAVLEARRADAEAFEQAALNGSKDPGRKHELAAIKAQDEAHRIAVGATRAANVVARQLRAAIDGKPGDEAAAKVHKQIDADLDRLRASAQQALDDLGLAAARVALLQSIESTRKADHVTLRDKAPSLPEAERELRALLHFDPREDR